MANQKFLNSQKFNLLFALFHIKMLSSAMLIFVFFVA